MTHTVHSAALPRSKPSTGFAACMLPFAVMVQGNALIGKPDSIVQLGRELSDCGYYANLNIGVFRVSLSM